MAPRADRVAGVVDWAGARVGDCALDLVTLAFACERENVDQELLSGLRERLVERTSPVQRQAYCAHMALRMVDWAIRHCDPGETDLERYRGTLARPPGDLVTSGAGPLRASSHRRRKR